MPIHFAARIPIHQQGNAFTFKDPAQAKETLKAEFPTFDFETDPPRIARHYAGLRNRALEATNGQAFQLQSETDNPDKTRKESIMVYAYNGELYTKHDYFKANLVGIANVDQYDWTGYRFPD